MDQFVRDIVQTRLIITVHVYCELVKMDQFISKCYWVEKANHSYLLSDRVRAVASIFADNTVI